jgi:hypothetical protein
MYQSQIHALYVSGLLENAKLHIGVVGDIPLFYVPDNAEVVYHKENNEETDTIKMIRDFCFENPDAYIMYFHTKCISRQTIYTESWRHYMEYFMIYRWPECVEYLNNGYDCCGTNWDVKTWYGDTPHFSGNFWWANASYINTLDHSYLENDIRVYREFWIGSNKDVKMKEIHNSGMNNFDLARHYHQIYPEYEYMEYGK